MVDYKFLFVQLLAALSVILVHNLAISYAESLLTNKKKPIKNRGFNFKLKDIFSVFMLVVFFYSWSRPLKYKITKARKKSWSVVILSLAGLVMNLLMGLFLSLLYITYVFNFKRGLYIKYFLAIAIYYNITFAIFNLLPIPGLDGFRSLYGLSGRRKSKTLNTSIIISKIFLAFAIITGLTRILDPIVENMIRTLFVIAYRIVK